MTALSCRDSARISAKVIFVRSGQRAARGGPPMEDLGRESDHLMLITPERVFYAGLLGRPRKRTPGSCHIYVAVKGSLHLSIDEVHTSGEIVVTLPNQPHTITSDYRTAISVTLEPECMPNGALEAL